MCFNARASFSAWGLSIFISIYLYRRNKNFDRWNAIFIATFTTIQLLEGLQWYKCLGDEKMNNIVTRLTLIVLLLQPLSQTYGATTHNPKNESLKFMLLIFVIIVGVGMIRTFTKGSKFHTTIGEKGHLVWHDGKSNSFIGDPLTAIFYLLGLFIPLLYMGKKGIPLIFVGLLTAAYSMFVAGPEEFSSYWCFTSVVYGVVAIFL